MKMSIAALGTILVLITGVVSLGAALLPSTAVAQELPGMCNGRTDANVSVNAHANGRPSDVPKYILNLTSDSLKNITGTLVLGQGSDRLQVTDWCRMWQHIAGEPFGGHGGCSDVGEDHGSTNLHAVGIATYQGEEVLVRTDVRENDEGLFFRVRWRAIEHDEGGCEGDEGGCEGEGGPGGDEGGSGDEGGCEDDGWTRVPEEGWLPLEQLKVRGDPSTAQ